MSSRFLSERRGVAFRSDSKYDDSLEHNGEPGLIMTNIKW